MIVKCPECGQWVEVDESSGSIGGIGAAAATGAAVGSIVPGIGTLFGAAMGAVGGLLAGSGNTEVECPTCGYEWEVSEEDDQTEIYETVQEQKENVTKLCTQVHSYENQKESAQQGYIQALRAMLEEVSDNMELMSVIYDTLAYSHYKFYGDYARAFDYVNKSLSLYDDPRSKTMRGIFRGEGRSVIDNYNKLTDLQNYVPTDLEQFHYLTDVEICAERDKTLSLCRDHFLEIPYSDRKFLMVVPTLDDIPQGSMEGRAVKILPQAYVPSELQILGGVLQQNVVYVCHPYLHNCYILYENFEQELLKDQVNELQIFLGGLGAKSIQIIDAVSDSSESQSVNNKSGKVGGKYKGMGGNVSGEMERRRSGSEFLAKALNVGSQFEQQPAIQVIESGWFKGNKDWQDMARLRQIGHTHYNLTVSSSSSRYVSDSDMKQLSVDFDVLVCSGEVGAKKTSSHEFRRSEEHSWTLGVEFYPLSSYNKKEDVLVTKLPISTEKGGINRIYYAFVAAIIVLLGIIVWLLVR